jgi:ubiquinol-cytochrome c reductase cytochrome b subunit
VNLTQKIQQGIRENLTLEDLLPTRMPVYVNSVAYLFGVAALSSLVVLALTGVTMAIFGPTWYHNSSTGRFVNSVHFWGVQLLFFSLVAHILTKIFMSAWRDGRWKTWFVGTITFIIAALAALTGFLAQTNWDSQWIAVQAKDLMNAVGLGALFNPMNIGQVLSIHLIVLPFLIAALVGIHLILVRREGPVKPIPKKGVSDE